MLLTLLVCVNEVASHAPHGLGVAGEANLDGRPTVIEYDDIPVRHHRDGTNKPQAGVARAVLCVVPPRASVLAPAPTFSESKPGWPAALVVGPRAYKYRYAFFSTMTPTMPVWGRAIQCECP